MSYTPRPGARDGSLWLSPRSWRSLADDDVDDPAGDVDKLLELLAAHPLVHLRHREDGLLDLLRVRVRVRVRARAGVRGRVRVRVRIRVGVGVRVGVRVRVRVRVS